MTGKIDGDGNARLSKSEMMSHMAKVRMSKRQVADWLAHAVGLSMHVESFVANSITGYDLPGLLENDGQHILEEELGITSKLHQKKLRRAIVYRLLGDPPPRPATLACEPGAPHGSIVLSWEADDSADDDHEDEDVTYRVRRQDQATREWVQISAGSSNQAFIDTGLDAAHSYAYKLNAWNLAGVSERRKVVGCQPKGDGEANAQSMLLQYVATATQLLMSMGIDEKSEVVGFLIAVTLVLAQVSRGHLAAAGAERPCDLNATQSAPPRVGLSQGVSQSPGSKSAHVLGENYRRAGEVVQAAPPANEKRCESNSIACLSARLTRSSLGCALMWCMWWQTTRFLRMTGARMVLGVTTASVSRV